MVLVLELTSVEHVHVQFPVLTAYIHMLLTAVTNSLYRHLNQVRTWTLQEPIK